MLRIDSKRNESFRRLVLIKLAIKAIMDRKENEIPAYRKIFCESK